MLDGEQRFYAQVIYIMVITDTHSNWMSIASSRHGI